MGVLPPASAKHGCPPCTLAPCIGSAPHTPAARPLPSLQVCGWFAARCDLILLLFDPYKLDISDEFKSVISTLRGHDDKVGAAGSHAAAARAWRRRAQMGTPLSVQCVCAACGLASQPPT